MSIPDLHAERQKRAGADVDAVVVAVAESAALEIEAVEVIATGQVEVHLPAQVPLDARADALVVIEEALAVVGSVRPEVVLGVPVESRILKGVDSLLSIVQMPAGIPVPTLAIGEAGAKNAALSAISILALGDDSLRQRLIDFRSRQTDEVAKMTLEDDAESSP